jgi:acyl-CoA thioester hydrolase
MDSYIKQVEIKWSDLDPNFHVRHSVYYDFGAYIRMSAFIDFGLTIPMLAENNLGPILFREECLFKREIQFGDEVSINLHLAKASSTYSRWTIQHQIMKNKETVAAIITVDGSWIDTIKRKLIIPTEIVKTAFDLLPRSSTFEWIEKK